GRRARRRRRRPDRPPGHGPDHDPKTGQVAAAVKPDHDTRRPPPGQNDGAKTVVPQRGLPGGPGRLPGQARPGLPGPMMTSGREIAGPDPGFRGRNVAAASAATLTRAWVEHNVPAAWRDAAAQGGRQAIRAVRTRADYE